MALNNILYCHHLSIIADLLGEESYRERAFTAIDAAIAFFEKVHLSQIGF